MNIARLLLIGTMKMGFSQEEVLRMTPRKFFALYDEYLILAGVKKDAAVNTFDALP